MAARGSRTDAVLVVVALLLVTIWFILPKRAPDNPLGIADWSDMAAHPPSRLTIRRGNQRIAVEIHGDATTSPRYVPENQGQAAADPVAIDRLIHALGQLAVVRSVDAPEERLGLEHPSLEIELETHNGKRSISLGSVAPSPESARYARLIRDRQRQDIVVAPTSVGAVDIEPDSLLDHRVLDWVPSELRRIELTGADGPTTLERQESGSWLLAGTPRARARRASVERLLLALTELSVTKFLEPPVAAAGLRDGHVVELALRAKRDQHEVLAHLKVGGKCPLVDSAVVLTLDGSRTLAGCVDATTLKTLVPNGPSIVDDSAFSLHGDEVERLEVFGLGPSWTLERQESGFQLKAAEVRSIALSAGNGLLDALVSVHGRVSGPCDFQAQHERPLLALRSFVVGEDGPSSERVRLGLVENDGSRRICRDDGIELVVAPHDAPSLDIDPTTLRDPNLLDVPYQSITELRVETPAGRQLLRANQHGDFALVEPQHGPADAAAIETLRERLSQLRAARWLPLSARRTVETRACNGLVEFVVSHTPSNDEAADAGHDAHAGAQPIRHRLRLLLEDARPTVGWFDEDPNPFQLDTELAELVDGLLLDRSMARLTSADRAITLSRGPDQIRLERQGEQWTIVGSTPSGVDQAPLVAALANLRALSVQPLLKGRTLAPDLGNLRALQIAYASDGKALTRPRLRFEIGARFKRHGQWVRTATLFERNIALVLRDADLQAVLVPFGQDR
jgi:hypothetical protein